MFSTRDPETYAALAPTHNSRPPLLQDAYRLKVLAWQNHAYAAELVAMTNDNEARYYLIEAEKILLKKAMQASTDYAEFYKQVNAPVAVFEIDKVEEAVL